MSVLMETHPDGTILTFLSSSGGFVAQREGFTGAAATRSAALRHLEQTIARNRDEQSQTERDWRFDIEADSHGWEPSGIEGASW